MHIFMKPVFGVTGGNLVHEFAKSRGGIHIHSTLKSNHPGLGIISDALSDLALTVDDAMEVVHDFIRKTYKDNQIDAKEFPTRPDLEFGNGKAALLAREKFCMTFPGGKDKWSKFTKIKDEAIQKCSSQIADVMEGQFGMEAIHIGNAPHDLPKPGGLSEHGYRTTDNDHMQSAKDILHRKELKKPKWTREDNLVERRVNIDNHCRCHCCSDYCLKYKKVATPFDAKLHKDIPENDIWTNIKSGVKMANVRTCQGCKFKFGIPLKYDPSGENNLTRGIPRQQEPVVLPDDNGMMQYTARRNHPRIVQSAVQFPVCYCSLLVSDLSHQLNSPHQYWSANNDIKILMINKRDQTFEGHLNPRERIKRHTNNLVASGLGGLEHYHCLQSLSAYLTQYECKGNESSSEWKDVLTSLNDTFCNDDNNANKTVRSLIGKQMNEVMRAKSVSKDQSVFQLSGGKLKRTSAKYMFRCSLTSMDLNEFAAMGAMKKKPKKQTPRITIPPMMMSFKRRRITTLTHGKMSCANTGPGTNSSPM